MKMRPLQSIIGLTLGLQAASSFNLQVSINDLSISADPIFCLFKVSKEHLTELAKICENHKGRGVPMPAGDYGCFLKNEEDATDYTALAYAVETAKFEGCKPYKIDPVMCLFKISEERSEELTKACRDNKGSGYWTTEDEYVCYLPNNEDAKGYTELAKAIPTANFEGCKPYKVESL